MNAGQSKGRNISTKNLKEIFDFINTMNPQNVVEERNKIILYLAFVENMSSLTISKLNDSRLVSYGNRSRGKQLTHAQISRIIKSYGLVHQKKSEARNKDVYDRRKKLTNKVNKGEIKKPHICGCCGETENLELHHIIPVASGGGDDYFNLIYLCAECHKKIHKKMRSLKQ